jgi:hypothetical protein
MILLFPAWALCQGNPVLNPSFEQGDVSPASWVPQGPGGTWAQEGHTGARCVTMSSVKADSANAWVQTNIPVDPLTTYRFSFWARSGPGASGGCIISGPDFANRDTSVGDTWEQRSHVFITPTDRNTMSIRVGQWSRDAITYFDDVAIARVWPVHRTVGGVTLGAGERVSGESYTFTTPLQVEGLNYARPLADFNAGFNTNRWVFSPGSYVVYRHDLNGIPQVSARVKVRVGYHTRGDCLVEASRDGKDYVLLGRLSKVDSGDWPLPAGMLPATTVYVRLRSPGAPETRAESAPGSFQVHGYEYTAQLAKAPGDGIGATTFLDVQAADPAVSVNLQDLGSLLPPASEVRLTLRNTGAQALQGEVQATIEPHAAGQTAAAAQAVPVTLAAGAQQTISAPYALPDAGAYTLRLRVTSAGRTLYEASADFTVPSLYAAGYGYPLGGDAACTLWWCEDTYKVSRERAPVRLQPGATPAPVKLSAARNEFEPVQVVLSPERDLKGLTATVTDLAGPDGARIPATDVSVCYAWYHYVHHPTDATSCVGWWPDALPPLDSPLDLKAGQNQPLWITVHVQEGAAAGNYIGQVKLQADGWAKTVPLELRVWNFTLPKESSVASCFGISHGNINRYHNLTTDAERAQVWDLYMQSFRDHRISPSQFWRHPIVVSFTGLTCTGGEVVTGDAAGGTQSLKLVDDSDTRVATASFMQSIPVDPNARYVLSFSEKTAQPDQKVQVSLNSYDAGGQWISGHNLDVNFTGTGQWQKHTMPFRPGDRSPQARSLTLNLRPIPWAESGAGQGTAWFDDVKLTREGSEQNLVEGGDFEPSSLQAHAKVDFTEWDKEAERYLNQYHFSGFRLPVMGLGGGTFYSRTTGQLGPYLQGTPEWRRLMKEYLGQVEEHLRQKGWLDKAYTYWFDEPDPKDYDFVRDGNEELKRAAPGLRRLLTEQPEPALFGAVDIWCPVLGNFAPEPCLERQQAGDAIWWYVCTGPKAPWPTLFIDHNAVDLRVWLWMTWKWNVRGILVWESTYWNSPTAFPETWQNPWDDPMGYTTGYGQEPGTVAYWGNGDGRFLSPPNKDVLHDKKTYVTGPVSSIRWEMLREGLEDFEYFALLRDLVARRGPCPEADLLAVPQDIVKTTTDFGEDPQGMLRHREALARAIEKLEK